MNRINWNLQETPFLRQNRRESEAVYMLNVLCEADEPDYSNTKHKALGPWANTTKLNGSIYSHILNYHKNQICSISKPKRTNSLKRKNTILRTPKISDKSNHMPKYSKKAQLISIQHIHFNSFDKFKINQRKGRLPHINLSKSFKDVAVPTPLQHFFSSDFKIRIKDCINSKPIPGKLNNSMSVTMKKCASSVCKRPNTQSITRAKENVFSKGEPYFVFKNMYK